MTPRRLVVNADDLGLSAGVNEGVFRGHDEGIVTSASLMVRRPAARDAARGAGSRPALGVGLHLDLGEWVFLDGGWEPVDQVVDHDDAAAVADELRRQLAAFRELMRRDPTHLDSHQHVHLAGLAGAAARELARELGVPLREWTDGIRYCGDFYGQTGSGEPLHDAVTVDALVALIRALPPGVTELACHPAAGDDHGSAYGMERELELRALCDPRVADALREEGIRLCSFAGLAACAPG